MEKISKILLIILLFLVVFSAIFLSAFSQEEPKITHSLTKAICEENICQDYEITCRNKTILSISPTGNAVQFSENWIDVRTEEDKNNLC